MYIHNYTYIYTRTYIKRMCARIRVWLAGVRAKTPIPSPLTLTSLVLPPGSVSSIYACSKVQRILEAVKPDKEPWRSPAC